jgi:uncharacterized protein YggE
MRFSLRDCKAALTDARKAALEASRRKAEDLARSGGVSVGGVIGLSEQSHGQSYNYRSAADEACTTDVAAPPGAPRASEPEVKVRFSVSVSVVYSLGGAAKEGPGLASSGSGSVTARADGAQIVVIGDRKPGPGISRPLSAQDGDDIVARLAALGVDRQAVELSTPSYGGLTFISVRVPVERVKELGPRVTDSVKEVTGGSGRGGVRFTHSNCAAVQRAARDEAMKDAREKATALAGTAGVKMGPVQGLSEYSYSPYGGPDPCAPQTSAPYYGFLPGFDVEPKVEVWSSVSVAYSLAP